MSDEIEPTGEPPSLRFQRAHIRGNPLAELLQSVEELAEPAFYSDPGEPDILQAIARAHHAVEALTAEVDLNEIARLAHACDEAMGQVEHGSQVSMPGASEMLASVQRTLAQLGFKGQHRFATWESEERRLAWGRSSFYGEEYLARYEKLQLPRADAAWMFLSKAEKDRARYAVRLVGPRLAGEYLAHDGTVVRVPLTLGSSWRALPDLALFATRHVADCAPLPEIEGRNPKGPDRVLLPIVLDPGDPRLTR